MACRPHSKLKMSQKTIRIKLIYSVASTEYDYIAGQEVDAPEYIANDLIQAGHATICASDKPSERTEKAISKQAQTAEKR